MADADEDAIPLQGSTEDDELGDEAVDYRFLTTLSKTANKLPQRGEKDFEPNPTAKQASALDVSREAMCEVLSVVRIHSARNTTIGQYLPDEKDWDGQSSEASRTRSGALKRGEGRCVVVDKLTSTYAKNMGQADRRNWTWLLPEEALYLLERGTLDIRWPDTQQASSVVVKDAPTESDTASSNSTIPSLLLATDEAAERSQQSSLECGELPMSLQGAYASFIDKSGLSLERYTVYANLRRIGYIVQRAATWEDYDLEGNEHVRSPTALVSSALSVQSIPRRSPANLVYRILSWLFTPKREPSCPSFGPLISTGLFRDYAEIFREIALVPYHKAVDPNTENDQGKVQPTKLPFRISFDVWKPATTSTWRKSNPPPPDFRIAVVDARNSFVPTVDEIGALLDTMPLDELPPQKKLENRLKHGRRNVILAIVDSGLVSYLRFSDACFGDSKLFEEKRNTGAGWKKGGGWKGRGKKKGGEKGPGKR